MVEALSRLASPPPDALGRLLAQQSRAFALGSGIQIPLPLWPRIWSRCDSYSRGSAEGQHQLRPRSASAPVAALGRTKCPALGVCTQFFDFRS